MKPPSDQPAPISSLKSSLVDSGYEECVEALKHAEDDTSRAAIMGQVIGHLKTKINSLSQQLEEVKHQMSLRESDLETQVQIEKNLRHQAQEEKAQLRLDLI